MSRLGKIKERRKNKIKSPVKTFSLTVISRKKKKNRTRIKINMPQNIVGAAKLPMLS